jgi:Probable lipoprotein LpqN
MRQTLVASLMAAVALAGCGGSGNQKSAEQGGAAAQPGSPAAQTGQAGDAAGSVAQGLQQMAQGLQQLQKTGSDGKPVPPVDFEKLQALLPNPSGWEMGKSEGQQMTMPFAISNAEVSYAKGDQRVKLTVTDSALNQMFLAPLAMFAAANYSERSSSGYKKGISMGGSPGFESWDIDGKHGEVTLVVANRFVVQGEGSDLDSIESVRAIVSQVDLAKLAAVK